MFIRFDASQGRIYSTLSIKNHHINAILDIILSKLKKCLQSFKCILSLFPLYINKENVEKVIYKLIKSNMKEKIEMVKWCFVY